MKLICFFEMYNRMFQIQDDTKDFWYIMGYASKRLKMYFQFCSTVFTLSNKIEKCSCIRFLCLFVRPVCAHSNSHKFYSNVFKFIDDIHISYRMDSIVNEMYGTKCLLKETHKFFRCISAYKGNVFKVYRNTFILY